MNREELKDNLKSVWYSFWWRYPNEFLKTPKWKLTNWRLRMYALELDNEWICTCIYFSRIIAFKYEEGWLWIWDESGWEDPSVFIQFYNN